MGRSDSTAGPGKAPTVKVPANITNTDAGSVTRPVELLQPVARLCVDAPDVANLLGLSLRTVRAMDARGALPMALSVGRRRLWRVEELRAWVGAGMPSRTRWNWGTGGGR